MGKATITGGGTSGQYTALVRYRRDTIEAQVAELEARADRYRDKIDSMEEGREKNMLKAQLLGVEKRVSYLGAAAPEDKAISVWCADLTEDLSGDVGLVEVPGQTQDFNIVPGFGGTAPYNIDAHGFVMPTVGLTAAQAYSNLGLLPAWQKWKPTFRYGAITSLAGDTCAVALEAATSTQQALDVNQGATLSGVPIKYMDCDGGAFKAGDTVLIKFNGQDFGSPEVVGFKDNPQPCAAHFLVVRVHDRHPDHPEWNFDVYLVYDLLNDKTAEEIPDGSGGYVSFPASGADLAYWFSKTKTIGLDDYGVIQSTELYGNNYGSETLYCAGENWINTRDQEGGSWDLHTGICFDNTYGVLGREQTIVEVNNSHPVGEYGCVIDYSYDSLDAWTFENPTLIASVVTSEVKQVIKGSKADSEGSEVIISQCDYSETAIGADDIYNLPTYPQQKAWWMESNNVYMLTNYISWNTSRRDLSGTCAESCTAYAPPLGPYVNDTYQEMVFFRMLYDPDGETDFNPALAQPNNIIENFIKAQYDRYRTNGFPQNLEEGPIKRVRQEYSVRTNK